MVKLKVPLMSQKAQGTIGGILTYEDRQGQARVIKKPDHRDAKSAAQETNRSKYMDACAYWNGLHEHEKEFYNYLGHQVDMTGFNYCVASYMEGWIP